MARQDCPSCGFGADGIALADPAAEFAVRAGHFHDRDLELSSGEPAP